MSLLKFTSKGIYCSQADVYLDPWKGVNKALITHGHSDHARWGSKHYITNEINVPIIKHRLGSISVSGKKYGESFKINGVKFSFHPAGHVPGSSQIRVEYRGEVWVFTGDYKTQKDGISSPFEPIKCNTFITECTFGLPVFQWEEPKYIHAKINDWWAKNQSEKITSLLMGYSLGKIQRLLKHIDPSIGKIYTHAATEQMTKIINNTEFNKPKIDIISNVTANPINDPKEIKKLLIKQIENQVRWRESVINMISKGINHFIEIGPGKVLSGMVKRTVRNINCFSINSIDDMKKINNEFKK